VTSIDVLPDDVLLAIFYFCANKDCRPAKIYVEAWLSLVHVCQRWRSLVFGSPRRLNLQLICTDQTPVREALDLWPPLPLVIQGIPTKGVENIVAALEHRDRVDRIELFEVNSSALENLLVEMQVPFLELTDLQLLSIDETVPVIPESFLGRSAPRLVYLALVGIPFPGLPNLLLSATHLVYLLLLNIPSSGYISPETMVTALSTLTSLESFALKFQSPRSHPDWTDRRLPTLTRSVLPVLTHFSFKGVYEYLDDLVACIDAPRVINLSITFFNDIVFDTPQFIQFISRTPTLKALENAHIVFGDHTAIVGFSLQTSEHGSLKAKISCRELDWQVSSLEQVCTLCLPPLSATEGLYICRNTYSNEHWQDNIENTLWLELLHPFTAAKNLYLSKEFALRIALALQELSGGRTTGVLPTLQNIFLEELQPSGPVQESIGKFVAERRLSGHLITISLWERVSDRVSVSEVDG
jgi:hypothetical protein